MDLFAGTIEGDSRAKENSNKIVLENARLVYPVGDEFS